MSLERSLTASQNISRDVTVEMCHIKTTVD